MRFFIFSAFLMLPSLEVKSSFIPVDFPKTDVALRWLIKDQLVTIAVCQSTRVPSSTAAFDFFARYFPHIVLDINFQDGSSYVIEKRHDVCDYCSSLKEFGGLVNLWHVLYDNPSEIPHPSFNKGLRWMSVDVGIKPAIVGDSPIKAKLFIDLDEVSLEIFRSYTLKRLALHPQQEVHIINIDGEREN